jgi:hypothetical protein
MINQATPSSAAGIAALHPRFAPAAAAAMPGSAAFTDFLDAGAAVRGQPGAASPAATTANPATGSEAARRAKLHKSATDFEAMFIGQMLTEMWSGVEVDPTFGGGHGEEMFRGMMTTEYGKMFQRKGGIGIATRVEKELLHAQGLQPEV